MILIIKNLTLAFDLRLYTKPYPLQIGRKKLTLLAFDLTSKSTGVIRVRGAELVEVLRPDLQIQIQIQLQIQTQIQLRHNTNTHTYVQIQM